MAKCEICKSNLQELFLKKINGTIVKDEKGKQHQVCAACQQKLGNDKKKMVEAIK